MSFIGRVRKQSHWAMPSLSALPRRARRLWWPHESDLGHFGAAGQPAPAAGLAHLGAGVCGPTDWHAARGTADVQRSALCPRCTCVDTADGLGLAGTSPTINRCQGPCPVARRRDSGSHRKTRTNIGYCEVSLAVGVNRGTVAAAIVVLLYHANCPPALMSIKAGEEFIAFSRTHGGRRNWNFPLNGLSVGSM